MAKTQMPASSPKRQTASSPLMMWLKYQIFRKPFIIWNTNIGTGQARSATCQHMTTERNPSKRPRREESLHP